MRRAIFVLSLVAGCDGCEDSPIPTAGPATSSRGSGAGGSAGAGGCATADFACCVGSVESVPTCKDGALSCPEGAITAEIGGCPDASRGGGSAVSATAASSSAASSAAQGSGGAPPCDELACDSSCLPAGLCGSCDAGCVCGPCF